MKLMLVDDEQISNYILKRFLGQIDRGLEVQDFTDPEKAFNAIDVMNPDIIFMDLNMPGLSGSDFLDRMQQQKLGNKVVVITSSMSSYDSDRIGVYPNVLRFLTKPVDKDQLRHCIESVTV